MSIDHSMLIISAVATSVTAIVIFFTLLEMAKQRRTSYKPEIVPIRQRIIATIDPIYKFEIPCNWLPKPAHEYEGKILPRDYFVKLFNIGNGAAKNIHVKWIFNLNDVIDTINEKAQKTFQDVYVEKDDKNWLNIKNKDGGGMSVNLGLDLEQNYDHLLPANIEKEGLDIRLPTSFRILVSLYYQVLSKSESSIISDKLTSKPHITISLEYYDIGGSKIKKAYTLYVKLSAIPAISDKNKPLECFDATFEY